MVILHRFQGELLNCTSFKGAPRRSRRLVPVCGLYGALHNTLGKRLRVVVLIVCNEVAQPPPVPAVTPSETMTSDIARIEVFFAAGKGDFGRMPTARFLASRYPSSLRLRSTVPAAPRLAQGDVPRKEVDARNIQRCKRLLPALCEHGGIDHLQCALKSDTGFEKRLRHTRGHCAVHSCPPPVPMPSLKTEIYRPLPSVNASAQSPQRDAPFAACCAKSRAARHKRASGTFAALRYRPPPSRSAG